MKASQSSPVVNSAPSIDEVNTADIPELAAYYKCTDYRNGVIPDHSGNGYDLSFICAKANNAIGDDVCGYLDAGISLVGDGYLAMTDGIAAVIDVAGTKLDTLGKYAIVVCEFYCDQASSDSDLGTAWQGSPNLTTDNVDLTGFQVQSVGVGIGTRVSWNEAKSSLSITAVTNVGETGVIAGCFDPSTALHGSISRFDSKGKLIALASSTTTTVQGTEITPIPASLDAQLGKFGLRATAIRNIPIKNYQVWTFDTEPLYMTETLKWMAMNPGKIPTWWIGL